MRSEVRRVLVREGQTFTYTYRANTDLIETITAGDGTVETYGYQSNTGRLGSIITTKGAQTLYSVTYEYNANDQREEADVTRLLPGQQNPESLFWDYAYDGYDQLQSAHARNSQDQPISGKQFSYTFDAIGNRTDTGWGHNLLNQVTTAPNAGTLSYADDRGNVTAANGFTYKYDACDRLIEGYSSSVKVQFGYDADGRRTWKKKYTWSSGQWTLSEYRKFAYDGTNLIAEFLVSSDGSVTLNRSYVWGPDLGGGVGGLLAIRTSDGSMYRPFYDGNGNVMGLTDSTGEVVASYEYDPFGKQFQPTGTAADVCPFRFSTKYFDSETGLSYFGYRYYNPTIQRWMSRDPITESGGVNIYAFCGNDPVNGVDPMGLSGDPQTDNYRRYLQLQSRLESIDKGQNPDEASWIVVLLTLRGQEGDLWNRKNFDHRHGRLYQESLEKQARAVMADVDRAEANLARLLRPQVMVASNLTPAEADRLYNPRNGYSKQLARCGTLGDIDMAPTFDYYTLKAVEAGADVTATHLNLASMAVQNFATNYILAGSGAGPSIIDTRPLPVNVVRGQGTVSLGGAGGGVGSSMFLESFYGGSLSQSFISAPLNGGSLSVPAVQIGRTALGPTFNAYNISTTGMTAAERQAVFDYARRVNTWLDQTGAATIQSTKGAKRAQASAAARAERLRAARAGQAYQGQAGHVPDTALTGRPTPPAGWLDMPGISNSTAGGGLGSRIGQRVDIITVDGEIP